MYLFIYFVKHINWIFLYQGGNGGHSHNDIGSYTVRSPSFIFVITDFCGNTSIFSPITTHDPGSYLHSYHISVMQSPKNPDSPLIKLQSHKPDSSFIFN